MQKSIRNSISLQLLKKVFIIYFSITFFITSTQIFLEYLDTKDLVHKNLKDLEKTFQGSLRDAIWDINMPQVHNLALSIKSFSYVTEVKIKDSSNKLIEHFSDEKIRGKFSHSFNIFKEYEGKTILLGRVELSSNRAKVIEVVETGIILIIISAMIKSLILSWLFIVAFKRYLIKPLQHMSTQLDSIDFENIGSFKIDLNSKPGSELSILESKFNHMLAVINIQKLTLLNLQEKYVKELEAEVAQRTLELEKTNAQLTQLASTDPLTNAKNRRSFYQLSQQYFELAKRKNNDLTVISFDLDNFKQINDTFGHQIGDKALIAFTQVCLGQLRESDIFGRLGGEEFGTTLIETNIDDSIRLVSRIIEATSNIKIPYENSEVTFTVSVGISTYKEGDVRLEEIIKRSDDALYQAKKSGKNRYYIL